MKGRPAVDLLVRQDGAHARLIEVKQERQEIEIAVPGRIGREIIVDEVAHVRPVIRRTISLRT